MRQKTVYIPEGEKKTWTDAQLVTFMCEVDGLVSTHMEECKAEVRERVGITGGKLVWKEHHVSVSKQGQPRDAVSWQKLAEHLLAEREDREELIARFSERKPPQAQRITIK